MIVFGVILQVERITVDSSDRQTSPNSQHLHGIGYAPSSSKCAQAWFSRPWTLLFVQAHACTAPCRTRFLHLAATLEPKTANVPSSNIKLFAHCCHDFCRKSHIHRRSYHRHAHRALHGSFHSFGEQMHMGREHSS